MEAIPDHLVSIQIHMPPEVLDALRAAARRAGLSIEDWLTRLLARRAGKDLFGSPV